MRPKAVPEILRDAFPHAIFFLLLLTSWNRWIEPYVDTGRELMVPWRIAQGESLYRDIHFHHGPLAPYLGAAIDASFGASFAGRLLFAALIALVHIEGLRRLAARFLAAAHASLAVGLAVGLAVFLSPGGWLFPFSFDTALAVMAITWALALWRKGPSIGPKIATAACLLAALLSRLELGLAAAVVIAFEARRPPRRNLLLVVGSVAAAIPVYAALSVGVPLEKLQADGWLRLLSPPEAFQNVYRAYAGLDRPALRLAELTLAAILLLMVASFLCVVAMVASRSRAPSAIETLAILLLAGLSLWCLRPPPALAATLFLLPPLVRVVPIVVIAGALGHLFRLFAKRPASTLWAPVPTPVFLIAALFAARLLLAASYIGPYDAFFLPLPTVVAVTALWRIAEKASRLLGASLPRLTTAALALFLLFRMVSLWQVYRRPGWSAVLTPVGTLMLREPVAGATRLALEDLERRVPRDGSLTGFPEAGFFNYALQRRNPLWLEQFYPGHLDASGERAVIRRLDERPPDALVLIDALAVGEGARAFGTDYLRNLGRFVDENFAVAARFGPGGRPGARIGDPDFFIEIRVPGKRTSGSSAPER